MSADRCPSDVAGRERGTQRPEREEGALHRPLDKNRHRLVTSPDTRLQTDSREETSGARQKSSVLLSLPPTSVATPSSWSSGPLSAGRQHTCECHKNDASRGRSEKNALSSAWCAAARHAAAGGLPQQPRMEEQPPPRRPLLGFHQLTALCRRCICGCRPLSPPAPSLNELPPGLSIVQREPAHSPFLLRLCVCPLLGVLRRSLRLETGRPANVCGALAHAQRITPAAEASIVGIAGTWPFFVGKKFRALLSTGSAPGGSRGPDAPATDTPGRNAAGLAPVPEAPASLARLCGCAD